MNSILKSPSKIVFILVAITTCIAFFMRLLSSDDFMKLALMAFAFYFGYNPKENNEPAGSSK